MSKISVVYWSQSGNTAAMAEAVAKGVTDAGKEAEIVFVSSASIDELKSETAFALGCPAMGAEVLDEGEMEPFVTELEGCVAGKTIGLFGSYGWGDGEWMRDWVERMTAAGATVVGGEGVICQDAPDDDATAFASDTKNWDTSQVYAYKNISDMYCFPANADASLKGTFIEVPNRIPKLKWER